MAPSLPHSFSFHTKQLSLLLSLSLFAHLLSFHPHFSLSLLPYHLHLHYRFLLSFSLHPFTATFLFPPLFLLPSTSYVPHPCLSFPLPTLHSTFPLLLSLALPSSIPCPSLPSLHFMILLFYLLPNFIYLFFRLSLLLLSYFFLFCFLFFLNSIPPLFFVLSSSFLSFSLHHLFTPSVCFTYLLLPITSPPPFSSFFLLYLSFPLSPIPFFPSLSLLPHSLPLIVCISLFFTFFPYLLISSGSSPLFTHLCFPFPFFYTSLSVTPYPPPSFPLPLVMPQSLSPAHSLPQPPPG